VGRGGQHAGILGAVVMLLEEYPADPRV